MAITHYKYQTINFTPSSSFQLVDHSLHRSYPKHDSPALSLKKTFLILLHADGNSFPIIECIDKYQ